MMYLSLRPSSAFSEAKRGRKMACMVSEKQLDIGNVIKFLENISQYNYTNVPPIKPKAGEVHLFVPANAVDQGE